MERPVFHLRDRENKRERELDGEQWRGSQSERGHGGEGAQLTGASSGSGACFPKEVHEA